MRVCGSAGSRPCVLRGEKGRGWSFGASSPSQEAPFPEWMRDPSPQGLPHQWHISAASPYPCPLSPLCLAPYQSVLSTPFQSGGTDLQVSVFWWVNMCVCVCVCVCMCVCV